MQIRNGKVSSYNNINNSNNKSIDRPLIEVVQIVQSQVRLHQATMEVEIQIRKGGVSSIKQQL
mgnify:CR=1 FL=1